ncbi:MAG TPA: cyclic nucleotide-binding domain-containing protein [Acidimicrobiia bacterium]|nr:cyclic nucleotide-binding domain-containing protein [Acidimicrobiia bacterium]
MAIDASRLATVPLFAGLSDEERADAADHLEARTVSAGEHLSNEGGAGYFIFIIESGTAQVSRGGEVVAELGPGDFFGEAAVLETFRRTATVTALTPMTVFAMFGADFVFLESRSPSVHEMISKALDERSGRAH